MMAHKLARASIINGENMHYYNAIYGQFRLPNCDLNTIATHNGDLFFDSGFMSDTFA